MTRIKETNLECGFVNIYAPNEEAQRHAFWIDHSNLLSQYDIPWCLSGDFNVVKSMEDKIGSSYNRSAMEHFVDFIENLRHIAGLTDFRLLRISSTIFCTVSEVVV
ncbi:hypothetical protein PTKIN_Ptkin12aG0047300 [Pterospermum kingtungense]